MYQPPTGTVTFLFTDIEGSTTLWEQYPEAMRQSLVRHDVLSGEVISRYEGTIIKSRGEGDSLFCVFARATDAAAAAFTLQLAFTTEPWPVETLLRVRMALHTGEVDLREGDYYGGAINRCARLRAIAHGGQVLLSEVTAGLVRDALLAGARLRDAGEQRLQDLARPEHVFQFLHASLPSAFPPLRSLDALPNNLPRQLTSFVGREREICDVRELLEKNGILTLIGAGGCGKTRLALHAAADMLNYYPDGVWLVELAPLVDPMLVPRTVAIILGLREEPGCLPTEGLIKHLAKKNLLLVLDNCEHLLASCVTLVAALLRSCPNVHILGTSREPLGMAGEQAYRVPSLSIPDPKRVQTPESLSQYEAVRLFIERARTSLPGFAVTLQNAPAMAQVCYRLDGIPLAIELAAARVRVLPVDQIMMRLNDRFHLLTGGSRTALPRQQTLRALIDWSYDLLTASEQTFLRRLSVFVGGWTLEAAEEICTGGEVAGRSVLEEWEVLDRLTELADKSLVVYDPEYQGPGRYRLLETVREYALSRLREHQEAEEAGERHAAFYLGLAERAHAAHNSAGEPEWLRRLEADHDNLWAVLEYYRSRGEVLAASRFAAALRMYWAARGSSFEIGQHIFDLLSQPDMAALTPARGELLRCAAEVAYAIGDTEATWRYRSEHLSLLREMGDDQGVAYGILDLVKAARMRHDYEMARALIQEALVLCESLGEAVGINFCRQWLGWLAEIDGDLDQAVTLLCQSREGSQALGMKWASAWITLPLCTLAHRQSNFEASHMYIEEGLAVFQEYHDQMGYAFALERASGLACALGNPHVAARLYGAADRLREAMQSPLPSVDREDYYDREIAATQAALGTECFAAAWGEGRALSPEEAMAELRGL